MTTLDVSSAFLWFSTVIFFQRVQLIMDIFFWKCGVLLQHLNSVSLFFHKWLQRHAELLGNWFYTPLALKRWKIKKCGTIPFVRIVCDHHKYINIHQNKHPKICRKWAYIVQKCQWSTIQSLNWNKFCFYLFFYFLPSCYIESISLSLLLAIQVNS